MVACWRNTRSHQIASQGRVLPCCAHVVPSYTSWLPIVPPRAHALPKSFFLGVMPSSAADTLAQATGRNPRQCGNEPHQVMPELLLSNFRLLLMKLVLSMTWRPMKTAESNSVVQHSATAPAVFTAERVTKAASV